MSKLTALEIEKLSKTGRHAVGDGLYIDVDKVGNKSWLFRYQLNGKRTFLGLGGYAKKSNGLADARRQLLDMKMLVAQGLNPSEEKRRIANEREQQIKEANQQAQSKEMTFERCAGEWHERKKSQWRNQKHANQNINTLRQYAFPFFGNKPVADIDLIDIKHCLDPIWELKTETASRIRSRIESVLSYAIASGYRQSPNYAVWRGQLDPIYAQPEKLKELRRQEEGRSEHHKALHYQNLPRFYNALKDQSGVAAQALSFCILTVTRTKAIRLAKPEALEPKP